MIKKILVTLTFVLGFMYSVNAQKQRATLFLRNGDTIKGLAKITIGDDIIYRKDRKSQKQTYNSKYLKGIRINSQGITKYFEYKLVKKKNTSAIPKLMTVISKGKIDLYRINKTGVTYTNNGFGNNEVGSNNFGGFTSMPYSINNYYVGRKESDFVERLTSTGTWFDKSFKKAASEYFKDCLKLVKMIQDKTFTKRDLEEIVEFYNDECE